MTSDHIRPATDGSAEKPDGGASDHAQKRAGQRQKDHDPAAMQHPAEDVAAKLVGAERMCRRQALVPGADVDELAVKTLFGASGRTGTSPAVPQPAATTTMSASRTTEPASSSNRQPVR